jgi:uncharacterized protein
MSVPAALGWAVAVTFLFVWLLSVIVSLRPSAQLDLVSRFGCQVVAYLFGLFAILQLHAPRTSIRDFLGVRPTHVSFYPLALLLGLALEGPLGAMYQAIDRRWPNTGEVEAELIRTITEGGTVKQIALGLVLVVLGPILEEVFFRGALVRPLRHRHGAPLVVAVTTMLFAAAHLEPQKILPIGLFGLALGVLRVASGSLLPPILLHATYNAFPFLAILHGGEEATAPADGATLAWDAPLRPQLLAVSSLIALGLIALVFVVGSRADAAARARERDCG